MYGAFTVPTAGSKQALERVKGCSVTLFSTPVLTWLPSAFSILLNCRNISKPGFRPLFGFLAAGLVNFRLAYPPRPWQRITSTRTHRKCAWSNQVGSKQPR
ncbi:hypothetical protein FB45DRAFT_904407 [Roridomyces roridus]|uniref:Uncharacterized protein n=1 Tax=Roridomyces roridus TaxID=1738132 RepID=A0AAD7C4V2_9AGAR|nr:hypothetical protein FB45DRAFT_904407 [Roridomyces roridus]